MQLATGGFMEPQEVVPCWFSELGVALTGCRWDIDGQQREATRPTSADSASMTYSATATGFLAWLADHGWGTEEICDYAARQRVAGEPWPAVASIPHEVARLADAKGSKARLGAAQRAAIVVEVLNALGNPQWPAVIARSATTTPTADDLRLLREVPPHHG